MKPMPYGAQNIKFLEYERSSLIPLTSSELLKFENRTSVIIEISRFSGHRCPGINEGVFGTIEKCLNRHHCSRSYLEHVKDAPKACHLISINISRT